MKKTDKKAMTITKREMCLILAGALLIGYMVRFLHTVPAPYVPYTVQEAKCESQAWENDARYMELNGLDHGDPYVNAPDYPKTRHEVKVAECMASAPKNAAAKFTTVSVARANSARCDARGMEAVRAAQKLSKDQGFGMFQADGDTIYQNGVDDCSR